MQRAFVRETGADPAATDSSRVLRVPGFYNHKYAEPHQVTVDRLSAEIHRPEHLAEFDDLLILAKVADLAHSRIHDMREDRPSD